MKIKILHLYPDLLNLYGDRGNIECMRKRLMWRGIDAEVVTYTCEDSGFDLSDVDIVFIGGGSDREQKIVCHRLLEHKNEIRNYVEDNGVLVAVCGGYQLLGKYYKLENETIEGLDILNIYTEQGKKRLIGNIVLENDFLNQKLSVLKITAEELTSVITHRSAELFTVMETMKNPVLRVLCIKTLSQHICTDRFCLKTLHFAITF